MRKPGKRGSAKAAVSPLARLSRPLSLVAQVELALRQAIADDCFPNGKLPTEIELAEELGVSRETVRLAAEALQREGLLVKIRHRGTFTRPPGISGKIKAVETKILGYLQTEFVGAHGQEEVANRAISGLMLQGAPLDFGTRFLVC
jgi:DNA-binding transcriptional regulator YhcF (GntR family)